MGSGATPFKSTIVRLLAQHPYSAIQLLQRLKDSGYTGGRSILKAYVRIPMKSDTDSDSIRNTLRHRPESCPDKVGTLSECHRNTQSLSALAGASSLKELRLPTILRDYANVGGAVQPGTVQLPPYLLWLVEQELIDQERRATERRIKDALPKHCHPARAEIGIRRSTRSYFSRTNSDIGRRGARRGSSAA